MRPVTLLLAAAALLPLLAAPIELRADGDAREGARVFRACAACHSLEPGRHMSGPSLADMWERRAGTVEGFTRYSPALKSADVTWTVQTLDAWLADPRGFIPDNRMTFPGIRDAKARADLIAFLQEAGGGGAGSEDAPRAMGGDMMDMMSADVPSLKALSPEQHVVAITYCGDTYSVTTADGETVPFWERNLRFKTDSSADGPLKGRPALLPAGMMGDRASLIFAAPSEISAMIEATC
jgi:cytochrome c